MKKYHVAAGDGKGYYGIGYESYREAEGLLKISQSHDPQAHIVEEEYYFTNADRIRAMSDEELAEWIARTQIGAIKDAMNLLRLPYDEPDGLVEMGKTEALEWLKQPAETHTENADRCVCCGEIIPEGRQVCPNCLVAVKKGN